MKIIAIIAVAAACIAGYAAPTIAQECGPIDDLCRADKEMAEWRQRDRDADDRFDRLQRRLDADRDYEQRERHHDRTICQPGEDCRRTLWRSRR